MQLGLILTYHRKYYYHAWTKIEDVMEVILEKLMPGSIIIISQIKHVLLIKLRVMILA